VGHRHAPARRELTAGEVFGPEGDALADALTGASADEHIAIVEAFLRARLPAPDPRADAVAAIVDHMLAEPATARVADVAARFGLSPRALQRRFRHYVGISPKAVLQRSRMHEAVERVEAGAEDGAGLALDLGYSDQAHFINDFRTLVGRPPTRYTQH
jgi:AraC-like DNA-binding protein